MGGIASLWVLYPLLSSATMTTEPGSNLGVLTVCAAFGALLPDLDANTSRLQHFEIARGIAPFAPIGKLLSGWLRHRGPMHSLVGLAVASVLLGVPIALTLGWLCAAAVILGYASHLFLDAMTVSGIPLLYPNRQRFWVSPWRLLRIVTGSADEEGVFVALSLLAVTLLLNTMTATFMQARF